MEVERLVWLRVVLCLALASGSHEALVHACMSLAFTKSHKETKTN
jgi:hypothetical protein